MSSFITPLKALKRIEKEKRERTGSLYLTNLELKAIPPELAGMYWLQKLFLDFNQISRISGLDSLVNLQALRLSFNQLTSIEGLDALGNLKWLELHRNQLTDIDGLTNLVNLKWLDLSYNLVRELGPVIPIMKRNPALKLYVAYCPLPDLLLKIAGKGNQALLNHYTSMDTEGEAPYDQIKLIFLGNSSCGKTSLSKFLITEEFDPDEASTHGIRNTTWLIPDNGKDPVFTVNVLDFGGQEYYHATHRMFLTSDAIYVVVCTRPTDRNGSLPVQINVTKKKKVNGGWLTRRFSREVEMRLFPYSYWLQTVSFYTGSKGGMNKIQTVHLVENKSALSNEGRRIRLDPNFEKIFPFQFKGFYELDTAEAYAYNRKKHSVFGKRYHLRHEVWKDELIADLRTKIASGTIPGNYPVIRDVLKDLAESLKNETIPDELASLLRESGIESPEKFHLMLPWISYEDYERIVRKHTKSANPDFGNLHTYLQDHCGRILYFPDKPGLKENVCIDPNWLHEHIYEVLNEDIRENSGLFNLEHVEDQVEGGMLEAEQMVDIMKKFYLIFEVAKGEYIAPQYLPEECPEEKKMELSDARKYAKLSHELSIIYPDYLPPSIISQYIAHKGSSALRKIYWKYGLLYEEKVDGEDIHIFVECIEMENGGEIRILLPDNEPEDRKNKAIRKFVATFADQLQQAQYIQLRKSGLKAVPYEMLCRAKEYGRGSLVIDNSNGVVDIRAYFPYLPDFDQEVVRVFISYAHRDSKSVKVFVERLKEFMRIEGVVINIFSDLDIIEGEKWRQSIKTNISRCDLFLALVSQDFVNSEFIRENELGAVLKKANGGREVSVFPIRFSDFTYGTNNAVKEDQMFALERGDLGMRGRGWAYFENIYKNEKKVKTYMAELMNRSLTKKIKEIWGKKTGLEPG